LLAGSAGPAGGVNAGEIPDVDLATWTLEVSGELAGHGSR